MVLFSQNLTLAEQQLSQAAGGGNVLECSIKPLMNAARLAVRPYVCHFVMPRQETGKIDVLTIPLASG
jgi:hypothetical protein